MHVLHFFLKGLAVKLCIMNKFILFVAYFMSQKLHFICMKSVLLTEKNTRMLLKDENIKSESFCNIINCET